MQAFEAPPVSEQRRREVVEQLRTLSAEVDVNLTVRADAAENANPILMAPIRDPNDIVVIQTAITGGAEAVCTTDEDFFNPPASTFLESINIGVFTDAQLLKRLRP